MNFDLMPDARKALKPETIQEIERLAFSDRGKRILNRWAIPFMDRDLARLETDLNLLLAVLRRQQHTETYFLEHLEEFNRRGDCEMEREELAEKPILADLEAALASKLAECRTELKEYLSLPTRSEISDEEYWRMMEESETDAFLADEATKAEMLRRSPEETEMRLRERAEMWLMDEVEAFHLFPTRQTIRNFRPQPPAAT